MHRTSPTRRRVGVTLAAAALGGLGLAVPAAATAGTAAVPVIGVVVGGHQTKLSSGSVSGGWVSFHTTSDLTANAKYPQAGSEVQLFQLRPGKNLGGFQYDLERVTSEGGFTATLSQDAILHGGVALQPGQSGDFAARLAPGTYYVANVSRPLHKLQSDAQQLIVTAATPRPADGWPGGPALHEVPVSRPPAGHRHDHVGR